MSIELVKRLLVNTTSTMSKEEIVNAILNTPDNHLDAIGQAILTEKGKRGNERQGTEINKEEVVVEEVGTEVKNVVEKIVQEEAEEEVQYGLEEDAGMKGNEEVRVTPNKVALRTRLSKYTGHFRRRRMNVAKGPIRGGKAKKRCYDPIDSTLDDLEELPPAPTTPPIVAPMQVQVQDETKISVTCLRFLLMRLRGPVRKRMEGLANVMDGLDWTKIAGWNDLVSSLARGKHEMFVGGLLDSEVFNVKRSDMAKFVQKHSDRLENHPMFADSYETIKRTQDNTGPPSPPKERVQQLPDITPNIAVTPSVNPPFDWDAIEQHLQSLGPGHSIDHDKIIDAFCDAYSGITKYCLDSTWDPTTTRSLIPYIKHMAELAKNMSTASPPSLQQRLMTGHSIERLRNAMYAVCTICGGPQTPLRRAAFGKAEFCSVESQLESVESILIRYPGTGFQNGIKTAV